MSQVTFLANGRMIGVKGWTERFLYDPGQKHLLRSYPSTIALLAVTPQQWLTPEQVPLTKLFTVSKAMEIINNNSILYRCF
jgi:hypothetical protein